MVGQIRNRYTKLYISSVYGADGQAVWSGPCAGTWSAAELQGPEDSRARGPAHTVPWLTWRCSRIPAASALSEHKMPGHPYRALRVARSSTFTPCCAGPPQGAPHPMAERRAPAVLRGVCGSWAGRTASPSFPCKTSKNTYFCKIMFLYVELCKYTRPSGEKTHRGPARKGGGAVHVT